MLASKQADRAAGLTHTLRARVSRPDAEDELSRVTFLRDTHSVSAHACI